MKPNRDIAANEWRVEVERLMLAVASDKARLSRCIEADSVDHDAARRRNLGMPGILGQLWSDFIDLPKDQKIQMLSLDTFENMHWQSLLQCNPYIGGHAMKKLKPTG